MVTLDAHEAILFRMLVAFFGEDRVIPRMSISAVCGGRVPATLDQGLTADLEKDVNRSIGDWAKKNRCLFTIVNYEDTPKLVVEFAPDFSDVIEIDELHRRRYLQPVLLAAGISYVSISSDEFSEITRPDNSLDLCTLLQAKFNDTRSESP